MPKHTFILWLAVKQKLCTQDKLQRWYPNKVYECSLCGKEVDSHNHLFFKCEFAKLVWQSMCKMAKFQYMDITWDGIVDKLSNVTNGGGIWELIKKLCLDATVYYIWQERNSRIFNGQKRSAEDMVRIICDEIKAKMVTIKVKTNSNVLTAEAMCNIKFDRKV